MKDEEDYKPRYLSYLYEVKLLEEEAIERYRKQLVSLRDPDLIAYLEGVLRTELRHRREIEEEAGKIEKEIART